METVVPKQALELEMAGKAAGPCVFVLFGAAGDLTKRKLLPALFNLVKAKLLPNDFALMGVSVDDLSLDAFRDQVSQFLPSDDTESRNWLRDRLFYERGDFADVSLFSRLGQRLAQIDLEFHTQGNYLFYLAVAPKFFGPVVQQLGTAGLSQQGDGHWRRVVIEKPFGQDLESAKALNRSISTVLQENQIYRIDHYLGKETVQNIMVFRFDNAIFEPIWNRRYIDHVQITNAETVGVERRGAYFDHAGTLRDMVPNHVMQLLSLTAMEPPVSFHADAVRDEQAKVLHSIQPLNSEEVLLRSVRGSTARDFQMASEFRPTGRSRESLRNRAPRHSSRSSSTSTTGAGRESRFICLRESAWQRGRQRLRSSSGARRFNCSVMRHCTSPTPTPWFCKFSRLRESP